MPCVPPTECPAAQMARAYAQRHGCGGSTRVGYPTAELRHQHSDQTTQQTKLVGRFIAKFCGGKRPQKYNNLRAHMNHNASSSSRLCDLTFIDLSCIRARRLPAGQRASRQKPVTCHKLSSEVEAAQLAAAPTRQTGKPCLHALCSTMLATAIDCPSLLRLKQSVCSELVLYGEVGRVTRRGRAFNTTSSIIDIRHARLCVKLLYEYNPVFIRTAMNCKFVKVYSHAVVCAT
jgi:hypothetical protein